MQIRFTLRQLTIVWFENETNVYNILHGQYVFMIYIECSSIIAYDRLDQAKKCCQITDSVPTMHYSES